MATFTLFSNDVGGQATQVQEFHGFGCSGQNISPHMGWKHAPEGTKSFALTCYDKDAPTGSGFWHWLVFNIPASCSELPTSAGNADSGLLPVGAVQSITDYGICGYGGPCPPEGHGWHQYLFTVFALDTEHLDIDPQTSPAVVGFNLNAHTIEKASLVMYYKRG